LDTRNVHIFLMEGFLGETLWAFGDIKRVCQRCALEEDERDHTSVEPVGYLQNHVRPGELPLMSEEV